MKLINAIKSKIQQMREREQEEQQGVIRTFLGSSLHTIFICVMLLATAGWAYFSLTIDGPDAKIQTAGYGIRAEVISGGDVVATYDYASVTNGDSFDIELAGGVEYDVELTGLGSATWNGGYCIVSVGDNVRYTERIKPGEKLNFKIMLHGTDSGSITFLPYWGYYPDENPDIVETGGKYVVSGGDFVVSGGDFVVSPGDNSIAGE